MSQLSKQGAVDRWENSSEMLSSWWGLAQRVLSLSVQFLFFAEIARRSLAEREGDNIQIRKAVKQKRR